MWRIIISHFDLDLLVTHLAGADDDDDDDDDATLLPVCLLLLAGGREVQAQMASPGLALPCRQRQAASLLLQNYNWLQPLTSPLETGEIPLIGRSRGGGG